MSSAEARFPHYSLQFHCRHADTVFELPQNLRTFSVICSNYVRMLTTVTCLLPHSYFSPIIVPYGSLFP
ncbi:hypothetical protein CW304_00265 [Bacillus sp. UFRGS-B20]|nr:hypothetical protein CW304_00265 [Bacillus sp. UFRGS-B20]